MAQTLSFKRLAANVLCILLLLCSANRALALSNGCAVLNSLSGSSSLSYSGNRYPATDFAPGDTLTLSFTDSGTGVGLPPMNTDSVSLARNDLSNAQTYNATNSTSNSAHNVSITVPSGSLEVYGLAVRATTSHGQISNLVFTCTSAITASSDATLAGLSLSSGSLSPSFSSLTSNYSASVTDSVTSISVTPVVSENHATVSVNGQIVASGSATPGIGLTTGNNTISVVVTAQDGSTRAYSITVNRAEAPPVSADSSSTVASGSVNNLIPLALTGGTPAAVTLVTPPSHGTATLSASTVTYTPVAGFSGSDSFTWHASNSGGTSSDATVSLAISAPVLTVSPAAGALQAATAGTAWSQTLAASGGTAPYTWTSTALPPGITLNSASGTLSGTPSVAGHYNLRIAARDTLGATGSTDYLLIVNSAPPVASDSAATVAANSNNNPVTLSLSGTVTSVTLVDMPVHGTAVVSGTVITYSPAAGYVGNDSFTYTAANSSGSSPRAHVSLNVSPILLTLSPASGALPPATAGKNWSQTLSVKGGNGPYSFSAASLPAGITLNASTGVLSGSPAAAGTYTFQISAVDSSGSSGTASYTLAVNAAMQPLLLMQPGRGALPPGVAGKMYAQTFNVNGGVAPYQWQLNGPLPAGLTFADSQLSGTPQSSGNSAFTIQVTDATGNTLQTAYTLEIGAASAVATDHSATLNAGQSVAISLTSGATGGPFTGAQLLDQPERSTGTASVRATGADYELLFTAAAQASGSVVLRYTLSGPSGATEPARILLTITERPNPARDADVIGMVSAQYRAAQSFARAQLHNFSDRLEQLHSGADLPSDMSGIRFTMPSSRPEQDADQKMWATAWQHQRPLTDSRAEPYPSLPFTPSQQADRFSFWTGGYIDFGSDKDNGIRFSHTTAGISTGGDYRITPALTAGMGMGFGRDVSDIGDNRSESSGRAFSTALYGSYHPGTFFVDGLLGQGQMSFDSRRHVKENAAEARGSRSGRQIFSALTSGYEFRSTDTLISPYARLQYFRTRLDGYSETRAGAFSLAYAPQTFSQVITGGGLRGERAVPAPWGVMRLQGRLEYAQMLNHTGEARVGYADTGNDTWQVPLTEQSRQSMTIGTAIDFLLPHNITPGLAYQATLGLDAARSQDQMLMFRLNIGF